MPARTGRTWRRSAFGDVDDSFREGLRGFLRQIVPDAAGDHPVSVPTHEFGSVRTGLRMWGTIGIAFQGDCGHADLRTGGETLFQLGS